MPIRRVLLLLLGLAMNAAPAQDRLSVVATGHPNWPPFSWERDGVITGVGADVARLVLKEIGVDVTFRAIGNWKRAQAEAEAGKVDLITACYQTDARRAYLQFPAPPYTDDANVLWVAKGRGFPFKSWDDLVGRTGTAMLGDSYGQKFDTFLETRGKVVRVNTPLQNLQKLVVGHADYYPFSLYGGQIQVSQLGFERQIEHLPGVISTEGVYLCIAKKSKLAPLLPRIEAVLARLRADGTVDQLVRKHITEASRK
ncbi:MAG: substrate-binding periplasmic protein [Telluria sp.]